MKDVKELIRQKIEINRQIEACGGFSQEQQVLYLVDEGMVTPKLLIERMGIKKTNLSILCKRLQENGLLSKMTSQSNKKLVAYCLTVKGKHVLTKKIKEMEQYENL